MTPPGSARPLTLLLAAALLAALLAAGWDGFWRTRGFRPAPVDDVNLWGVRRRGADGDPRVLALAGSSRLLMGLDLHTLGDRLPGRRVVQLSVNGGDPLSVLEDLAVDPDFRGSAVCEILPHRAFTDLAWGEVWGGYRHLPWSQRVEGPIHVYLAAKTNLFLPDITLLGVAGQVVKTRRLPRPGIVHFDAERQGGLDFTRVENLAATREGVRDAYAHAGTALTGAALAVRVDEIGRLARKIRARGGSVLFFRMVSSSPVREVEAGRFPDAAYWDVFRARVGFPCLSYLDVPGLDGFRCPEGAHLDRADAPAYTAILGDYLAARPELLAPRSPPRP